MRIIRRISSFICIALVFLMGIMMVSTSVTYITGLKGKEVIEANAFNYFEKMNSQVTTKVGTLMIGLLLLLFSFVTIYLAIADLHSSGRIKLDSPEGKLTVSVSAVEAYLNRLGRNIDGVKELRAKIRRTPTGWALFARVTVWSDQDIRVTNESIHQEIRKGVTQILGERSFEPMDIHVSKIDERVGRVGSRRPVDVEFTSGKGF
jgi:hypothetical protein